MVNDKYKEIIKTTVHGEYSVYSLEKLLKKLVNDGLIKNNKKKKYSEERIDVSGFSGEKSKIDYLFKNLDVMSKKCEEFEYEKSYRYNHVYGYESINFNKINELIKEKRIIIKTDDNKCNDKLSSIIAHPTYINTADKVYLKFSMRLISKVDDSEDLKHPVLVIIHKNYNFIEIRQDVVPMKYNPIEKFYNANSRSVRGWLEKYLECKVTDFDLQSVTKYMKSNKQEDVKITALKLKRNGMTAELDSANNSDLMLPILDELRMKIDSESIFELDKNTKRIKKILEDFIEEIEETSDLPAAKALWKEKKYKVMLVHAEKEKDVSLIRWIGELKDKESMDYVTEYIIKCKGELDQEFQD